MTKVADHRMGKVNFVDVSKRVTLRVDGNVHYIQALERVSFKVRNGEIVALIGPSGCSKTTALPVATGLDPATGGRVIVDGHEVQDCGHDRGIVFPHADVQLHNVAYSVCTRSKIIFLNNPRTCRNGCVKIRSIA
jgi:ABC-type nitrate/sulfonate/bicarbonate transport system ATPase subunit